MKNDHGTISAILLGVFFYKTGLIHSLPIEKQTAVELGMLAIYNHTLTLKKAKPKSHTDYMEIVFALNPVSYLLRWCDDMQEWGREYFEIAPISNLLFCSECKTPLKKYALKPAEFFELNNIWFDNQEKRRKSSAPNVSGSYFSYSCMCPDSKTQYHFTKRDDFNRRKLLQIKACDNVSIVFDPNRKFILVDFQYDPYKLLRLANIHPSFNKMRQKEIEQIKRFISRQQFINGSSGYEFISIKHNLSPNPIYLKMLIIKDFLEMLEELQKTDPGALDEKEALKEINELYAGLLNSVRASGYDFLGDSKMLISKLAKKITVLTFGDAIKSKNYYNILQKNCKRYLALVLYQAIAAEQKCASAKSIRRKFKKFIWNHGGNDIRELLVNAALDRIDSYIAPEKVRPFIDTEKYVKDTDANDSIFTVVKDYCDSLNQINLSSPLSEEITYYTDLYMYEILSYQTELFRNYIADLN